MTDLNDFPQKPESEPKSTRPRTAAQTAASRENGRQSKGPTTKSGLDRSKMNAVKHGLCGEFLLIYGESIRAYSELRDQFMHRFQPQDGIECSIVRPQFLSIFGLDCSAPQLIIPGRQINGSAIVPICQF